jgi:hypothetical protein
VFDEMRDPGIIFRLELLPIPTQTPRLTLAIYGILAVAIVKPLGNLVTEYIVLN